MRKRLSRFRDHIATSHFFFLITLLIGHMCTANPLILIIGLLYPLLFGLSGFGFAKNKWLFVMIAYAVQIVLILAIFAIIFLDSWCKSFLFRYIFNRKDAWAEFY